MKKLTVWLVIIAMLMTAIPSYAFAADDEIPSINTSNRIGKLEMVLRLDCPVIYENIDKTAITITLLKENAEVAKIQLKKEVSWIEQFVLNGKEYLVEIKALDRQGVLIGVAPGDIKYVSSYAINFGNVPSGNYQLKLTGNGYKEYISNNLEIGTNSQHITVGTNDATFTLGDINADAKVDKYDLEKMKDLISIQSNQQKTNINLNGDLNQDGIIDITDLVYIYDNIGAIGDAVIISNPVIDNSKVKLDNLTTSSELLEALTLDDIDILFGQSETTNKAVSLKRPDNKVITKDTPIELPIEFKQATEMEAIQIIAFSEENAPKKGTAIITYDDDKSEEFNFDTDITQELKFLTKTDERSVITINLGKRVAVKKIIIRITDTTTANATLAEVAKLEFLREIIPDNPEPSTGIVKGLKAMARNEAVDLSWNRAANMTGYKIYYGTESGNYTEKLTTEQNSITISNLENMNTYYFVVSAVNGDWEGPMTAEVSATPLSPKAPESPKGVNITSGDEMLMISWSKAENATHYYVYYRKKGDSQYTKVTPSITSLNYTLANLINDTEYDIYITAANQIGESTKSDIQVGIPKKQILDSVNVPTQNKIDNIHITEVKLIGNNVDNTFYPNGYNTKNVIDGDYSTHWTAQNWWNPAGQIITFDEPRLMDYMVCVPRLDGKYPGRLDSYTITVWGSDDINGTGTTYSKPISNYYNGGPAVILNFPKTNVKKIQINLGEKTGGPRVSISELLFYDYYSLDDDIKALFADDIFREISPTATQEEIERLRGIIEGQEGHYFVDNSILLEELSMAESLLKGDTSKLGRLVNVEQGRNAKENHGFSMSLNDFQPLGVSAKAGEKIVLYISSPTGELPTLVATQYYPNWNNWKRELKLQQGRNIIEIPKIGSDSTPERGGSLYLTYSGTSKDIKIHAKGGNIIPILTVSEYINDGSEVIIKENIKTYINELTTYVSKLKGNKQNLCSNVTEIATPDVLLSIPASQALSALQGVDINTQVERLFNSLKAWEKEISIQYGVHGLSHNIVEGVNSWPSARVNIRYTKMFEGAFMYASSGHIGIEWGSTPGMLGSNFGWGISHEIGHVIDQSGLSYAEITNNIYSLFIQTYDNGSSLGKSRLELSNKYKSIYEKVSRSTPGKANDVFTQLGMYWQLHLAYDDSDNYYDFYSKLYRECRAGSYTGLDKDNLFVVLASKIAGKNLTPFFERWGISVSDIAKEYIKELPEETKAIYYINDEVRRYRLAGNSGVNNSSSITASVYANKNEVAIIINDNANMSDVLGYEIIRNGNPIAFTTEPTYTDIIGTSNNIAFNYKIKAYDKLLNVPRETTALPEIKIGYDVTVEQLSSEYNDNTITIDFGIKEQVAGLKFDTPIINNVNDSVYQSGRYIVEISTDKINWTIVKDDKFTLSSDLNGKSKVYFNKLGTDADDTRIGIYDAKYLKITGKSSEIEAIKDSIEVLAYPGDNIDITTTAIGYLKNDYTYQTTEGNETIKAGTLIVTGDYRGDPVYNVLTLKGMYSKDKQLTENSEDIQEERFITGYGLMFATVPESGDVSEISDGFWLFVPEIQKETVPNEPVSQEGNFEGKANIISVLPNQIKAELYRSIDPTDLQNAFLVSNTVWVTSPPEYAMPYIILEGENK